MRGLPAAVLIAATCLSVPTAVLAQSPGKGGATDAKGAARALAEKAFEAFEGKKFADAYTLFEQAEGKFHAPPHLLFMARSQEKLGKLVAARDLYRKVVDEKLANYAPDEFRKAQDEAKGELDALSKRVPTIAVTVSGAQAGLRVTIDGAAADPKSQAVDPGDHVVEVATDQTAEKRTVSVKEGGHEVIDFVLAGTQGPTTETPEPGRRYLAPTVAALGVGVLGVGIGAITGAMSLGKVSDVEATCDANKVCPKDQEATADSAKTLGTISTITFVVGGVGLAAGAVLFYLGGRPAAPAAAENGGVTVRPRIGLGAIGVDGSF